MPIIGYKKEFKSLNGLSNCIFTINFKVKYDENGGLKVDNEENNYFDVGDYNILLDDVINAFDENEFCKYDNGIYILSVCKYIVDKVPDLYSICYESKGMIDIYFKDEIISDYNKIRYNKKY